jgi:hypothetical protein
LSLTTVEQNISTLADFLDLFTFLGRGTTIIPEDYKSISMDDFASAVQAADTDARTSDFNDIFKGLNPFQLGMVWNKLRQTRFPPGL